MATRDHQFSVSSRCELLPYLLTLPLGLSRKAAKDLLRFRAVTVARMTTVKHDTQLEPGDVVTIAAGKQVPAASIERHGLKIVHLDDDIVVVDKARGPAFDGIGGREGAHRASNPQRSSEGADKLAGRSRPSSCIDSIARPPA